MSEIIVEAEPLPPREVIEYVEIPLRRPLLTLIPFLVIGFGSILAYYTVPRFFRSSTLILVESERVPESLLGGKGVEMQRSVDRLRVIKQEILSRTRLERIVQELEPYPEMTGKRTPTEIVENMRDRIEVRVKGEDAFIIEYVNKSPYLAMAVTNRLATLFIEEAGQARKQQMAAAHQFIETQQADSLHELESKEKQLRALKAKHMGSLPEELGTNLSTLQRLQLEKQSLLENLRGTEDRRVLVEKNYSDILARFAQGAVVLTDGGPPSELMALRMELASLRGRYTDEHPEVLRVKKRLERLEKDLGKAPPVVKPTKPGLPPQRSDNPAIDNARNNLDTVILEIEALKTKRDDLDQRIAALEVRVAETPRVEEELVGLTRDYSRLKENYDVLLKRKMDAEMAEKLEATWKGDRFRMLDPAFLPDKPYSPQILKFLGGGLGIGLLIGLGAAIGAELLDHSVKNARELEVVLPHPLLVTIPHIVPRRRALRSNVPQIEAASRA